MNAFILILISVFTANASTPCQKAYERLNKKDELKISLFFGYDDHDDNADDGFFKAQLVDELTSPCYGALEICDFVRDPDDADIFTKAVTRIDGKTQKVRLRVINSSVSASNSKNTGVLAHAQQAQSQKISQAYQQALAKDDIVFYTGHARRGTGPGFTPLDQKAWIKAAAFKPSLKQTLETLKTSKNKPEIIGYFSCEAEDYYGKYLHEASPGSALILTRQTMLTYDDVQTMKNSLDSLLRQDCAESFRSSLKRETTFMYSNPFEGQQSIEERLPEIYGFFEPHTNKFPSPTGVAMGYLKGKYETTNSINLEKRKIERNKSKPIPTTQ